MIKKIISSLKEYYHIYIKKAHIKKYVTSFDGKKNNIFLFQTPTHSNIGDHAIAEAQYEFLNNHLSDFNHIEINQNDMMFFINNLAHLIKPNDIITLIGGGNFGNEYMREENLRRAVIEKYPHNKILQFPQTVYYTNDEKGRSELRNTQNIINNHSKIILVAREKVSYELMQDYFPKATVLLTPDIVLHVNKIKENVQRKGALVVLRADSEKVLSANDEEFIIDIVRNKYGNEITFSDMHYQQDGKNTNIVDRASRQSVLEFKYNQFSSSEIAVTDRLHGMVLAAITGTPCIAFSNYNQKVSGTYEWIKDLPYIKFLNSIDDFSAAFEELSQYTHHGNESKLNKLASYYKSIEVALRHD